MIQFHLNLSDVRRINIALLSVARESANYANNVLPRRLSRAFVLHLINSVGSGRYSGGYAPYNEDYRLWKSTHSARHIFWYLGGDFLKALTTFKVYNGWFAGIPFEVQDKGWKSYGGRAGYGSYSDVQGKRANQPSNIAAYGWIMEEGGDYSSEGGGDHPARPLFVPAMEDFAKYYVPTEIDKIIPMLRKVWS
jgi:hypothetical protein